ncbi:unnamed protein product [Toxocara canis]|uniref:Peptidase S1 domain-containing protein n=1 Tax=Toxocara canis TaxID=6265 RepID=A0A183V2U9_TOXCA|nr:unnamed protein product [Toxocara canis]
MISSLSAGMLELPTQTMLVAATRVERVAHSAGSWPSRGWRECAGLEDANLWKGKQCAEVNDGQLLLAVAPPINGRGPTEHSVEQFAEIFSGTGCSGTVEGAKCN